GTAAAVALAAAVAAAALWMTGALGAVGAVLLASVILVAPLAVRAGRRAWSAVAVGAVALVLLGIVVRGAVLPEGFASERSLLFRWHYLVSSASIVAEAPGIGVGPDGYQAAYVRHRLPRNPEEVTSAHSIFVDWIADLGVTGVAWVALALILAWRAGARLARDGPDGDPPADVPASEMFIPALVLAALAVAPAIAVEAHVLARLGGLVRLAGLVAFVAAALLLGPVVATTSASRVRAALAAGALALLLHGQIEMTLTRPGSVVWAMVLLGLAGGTAAGDRGGARVGGAAVGLALIAAGWLTVTGAVPAARQQRLMLDAARALDGARDEGQRRREAARLLLVADEVLPTSSAPRLAAADQLLRADPFGPPAHYTDAMMYETLNTLRPLRDRGDARAEALAASVYRARFRRTGDEADGQAALAAATRLVEMDPNGLQSRKRLADIRWEAGDRRGARAAYEVVLRIDDDFELDPLKQLPERDRRVVEERLADR
ncbi:MAG: O-antigen ligase family protein, partial [Planctomycetes bacterium]|nr:O-antigen ligase family protein [Planctomycetota bacterium]